MPLKLLPPTSRESKRYLLVKLESDSHIDLKDVSSAIINGCLQFIGELGVAKAGLVVMQETWNPKAKTIIIRVNPKSLDQIKTALTFIKSITEKKVRLSTIKVSGSIQNLKGSESSGTRSALISNLKQ